MWLKKLLSDSDEPQSSEETSGSHQVTPIAGSSVLGAQGTTRLVSTSPSSSSSGEIASAATPAISLLEQRCGRLRSALGPGTEVQGRLSFDSPVSLDGNLKGMVRSTELIAVSEIAKVDVVSIVAKALVVAGDVRAEDAQLTERLEVLPGGRFIGNVHAPSLIVWEGGIFDGVSQVGMPAGVTGISSFSSSGSSSSTAHQKVSPSAPGTSTGKTAPTKGKKVSVEELIS